MRLLCPWKHGKEMSQGQGAVISLGSRRKTASGISPGLTDAAPAPLAARLMGPWNLGEVRLWGKNGRQGKAWVCSGEGERAPLVVLLKFYIHGTNSSRKPEF